MKVCGFNLSLGVLGVLILFSVWSALYSVALSIFFLKLFYFSPLLTTVPPPTILLLIFLTIMAPFFSYFTYLFYLSYFFFVALTVEVFKPLVLVFYLRAFRLLLDVLVFNEFFMLLFEVSTLVLIELDIELFPIVDILTEFFDEAELDFLSLLLSWEFERLRIFLLVTFAAFRII